MTVHTHFPIRYQIVGHIKEMVSLTDLCTTHPPQFKEFLFYTRRLKYQQVRYGFFLLNITIKSNFELSPRTTTSFGAY